MKSDIVAAIQQLAKEKNVSPEAVLQALEAALITAYRRDYNALPTQRVRVEFDRESGDVRVLVDRVVVDKVRDPYTELSLEDAHALHPDMQLGDVVEMDATPSNFGRIAAQTAKQVVLQRLREAERDRLYEEFVDREGDLVVGVIQRFDGKTAIVDLGKAEAVLPPAEQVPTETYRMGQRIRVYLVEVARTPKGPQIVVSRTHRNLLRRLFELEVPEIYNGTVEIKAIAREPGSRSKVAVAARQEGIDPVGSCVGVRGVRIQNIVGELNGEKIDVVEWNADPAVYVANALSPAQVLSVEIDDRDKTALVLVPERMLSLAIGKEGQNARLAAKLTGWRIDIKAPAYTSEASV